MHGEMPAIPPATSPRWRSLLVLVAASSVLAACGASGSSEMTTSGFAAGTFDQSASVAEAGPATSTTAPAALARTATSAAEVSPEESPTADEASDLWDVEPAAAAVDAQATGQAAATSSTTTSTTTTVLAATTSTAAPTTTTTAAPPTTTTAAPTTTTTAAPAASGDQLLWFWAPW